MPRVPPPQLVWRALRETEGQTCIRIQLAGYGTQVNILSSGAENDRINAECLHHNAGVEERICIERYLLSFPVPDSLKVHSPQCHSNEDEKRIVGNMISDACALPEPERDVSLTAHLCRSRDNLAGRIEEPPWIEPRRVVTIGRRIMVAFGRQIIPFGMNIPLYQSSSVVLCGTENGSGGCHRRTSLTIACIYGKLETSENDGTRERPTTESNSAWARLCTSGCVIIASADQLNAV